VKKLGSEHVIPLNLDASPSLRFLLFRTLMTMANRYATPEADVTITHHLPPPEGDSAQDVSMSFIIPPQVDASNLLDQNYDDFFSGPGFVTLSTPALPRHLANGTGSVCKATGTTQTAAVLSGLNLGQTLTKNSTAKLDPPNYRAESPDSLLSLSPSTKPATSTVDPGPPRPSHTTSKSNPDFEKPTSKTTPSMSSGAQPGIESTSSSEPSLHSTNPHKAQISRQFPTSALQIKSKAPAPPRANSSVKPSRIPSSGGEITTRVSHVQPCQPSWDL
jgi:hypothetical protein